MYYPDKRRQNNQIQYRKRQNTSTGNNNALDAVSNLFGNSKVSNYAMRNGRVLCQSIDKKAVLIDGNGNKIILKEHQTNFNTDKDGPRLEFRDDGRKFRKN